MPQEIVRFTGMFQWWSYTVSHGQLLLRRTKSVENPTRIDVLFKPVEAVQLIGVLHDPVIHQTDLSNLPRLALGEIDPTERKTFLIQARNFEGYVVAGNLVWHEDSGEYDDPSALLPDLQPTKSG